MPLLKKISKKHLHVGARTWRPPPHRDQLSRSNTHTSTQTELRTETTPETISEPSPQPPPQSSHQSTTTTHHTQPASSAHSQKQPQDEQPQRISIYSQSLNDASRSQRPSSEHTSTLPEQTDPEPQPYPDPQTTGVESHHHDRQSLHDQHSTSRSDLPPPDSHHYASSVRTTDTQREKLRVAEAENQAALQRSQEAVANLAAILKSENAQGKNEESRIGEMILSDTDMKLQKARAQIEESERKLEQIRKEKELFEIKEKEAALRELALQQLLQKEREERELDIKRAQETADRIAQASKQLAEEEHRRELEAIRRESEEQEKRLREEQEKRFREEQADQARRIEEQAQRQLEREREEEEAKLQAEMERVAQENREREEAEAHMRYEEEARFLEEQNAKQAIRNQFEEKERAMRSMRVPPAQRLVEQIRRIPNMNPVSYAHIYSSPVLGGYQFPSFPPTPRSPHLVPDHVKKAAKAHHKIQEAHQERLLRKVQEQRALAEQLERERLWEEQKRESGHHQESHRSADGREGSSHADDRRSRPSTSHNADPPDHLPDHMSHATQHSSHQDQSRHSGQRSNHFPDHTSHATHHSSRQEHSKHSGQRSRTGSVDRRDGPSHAEERTPRSARPPLIDFPTHPPGRTLPGGQPAYNANSQPTYKDNSPRTYKDNSRPAYNHNAPDHHYRQRGHSVGRRDGPFHMDTRLTRSARPAHLDHPITIPERGSQPAQVANNSSSTKASDAAGDVVLHARMRAQLEQREREVREREDAVLAQARAAVDQARAEAQEVPQKDWEQAVPDGDRAAGLDSHPSEQASDLTRVAEKRAAEAAAHFMNQHILPSPARRRKASMPHASGHRRVASHYHQRFNSSETASVTHSETISEPESHLAHALLDRVAGSAYTVKKDIESSVMLPVEHSSPIDYLENHARGRLLKTKGDDLARRALYVIAKDLGTTVVEDICLRDPVLVNASRVNFSAQGVAIIFFDSSPMRHPPNTPKQSHHAPLDSSHHEASPAHHDHRVHHTPALTSQSDPFDIPEPVPASPKPHQPTENVATSANSKRAESQGDNSATQAPFMDYVRQHRTDEVPINPRDRASPRVLEEEKYFDGFPAAQKGHDLPPPPRFVTPKVTLQSPSDTTSPSNVDRNSFYATPKPKPVGPSSPTSASYTCTSPTKQSTSYTQPFGVQQEVNQASHQEKKSSPRADPPLATSPAAPSLPIQSPILTDLRSSPRVTNTDSFKPSGFSASATSSPHFRMPSSPRVKASTSHPHKSPPTPRQSAYIPPASSNRERDVSRHQRSTSRSSWVSHPEKSTPTSSTVSPITLPPLLPDELPEVPQTYNYVSQGWVHNGDRGSPSTNNRFSSAGARPPYLIHHDNQVHSNSPPLSPPGSPGREENEQAGSQARPAAPEESSAEKASSGPTTWADETASFQQSIQASIMAAMAPIEEKVRNIVAQVSGSVRAVEHTTDQQQQPQDTPEDKAAAARQTPQTIPDIRLWSPRESNDYGSPGHHAPRAGAQQRRTPRQIPLPAETPCEKPLPPPTPREYPLPDSPSPLEAALARRSSSSASTPRRVPSRLSRVWNGEDWDALLDDLDDLHKPITPVPLSAFTHPSYRSHSSPSSKDKINSLPLIHFDDAFPN
ncbi:hypothetical protein PCANC_23106 [Puccinia coronata f. sp. avenae]|uniref:Uncharacterized protein n=1 Tax=Puccinia coronata f. sp. avenae TaxID=200324 RepID=A0A2N5U6H6_9BASI|nr:hypothetical protein PCANC_23106 [Puccinia coronata f. sp. avenae]